MLPIIFYNKVQFRPMHHTWRYFLMSYWINGNFELIMAQEEILGEDKLIPSCGFNNYCGEDA